LPAITSPSEGAAKVEKGTAKARKAEGQDKMERRQGKSQIQAS
jgi:hypothetical protein